MSTRSYVDHWPHAAGDTFYQWSPIFSYISHWPEDGDGPANVGTGIDQRIPYSYLDHLPKDGDLNVSVRGTPFV